MGRRQARAMPDRPDREESDALLLRIEEGFERHGFGLWAAERKDLETRPMIGFTSPSSVMAAARPSGKNRASAMRTFLRHGLGSGRPR